MIKLTVPTGFDKLKHKEVVEEINLTPAQAQALIQKYVNFMDYDQGKKFVAELNSNAHK